MNHLRRGLAPVTDAAWQQVDEEATRSLRLYLAGRKLVDVEGPLGWDADAAVAGTASATGSGTDGVEAAVRRPAPLVEYRTPFLMSLADLDTADRGNPAIDTDPVIAAARSAALAEDRLVFHGGSDESGGIISATPHPEIRLAQDAADYRIQVGRALQLLRDAGIGGPYALALGDSEYTAATEATEKGRPVLAHLTSMLGGDVVWAPAIAGGVVLSVRGGDFRLTLGQDFSIGYRGAAGDEVTLFLEESAAFQVLTKEAAVRLSPST